MKKLRSNKGESIAEALAALLVAVLGGLMVAGAVTSSNKSMAKTDALMRSYYERITALADPSSANKNPSTAVLKTNDGVWFTLSSAGKDGKGVPVIVYTENQQDEPLKYYEYDPDSDR